MRKLTATVEYGFTDGLKLIWKEKKYLRPFLILNLLFLLMLLSGKFSIEFYAVNIFKDTAAHINEYLAAVIIAFIHLVGSLIFIPLVQRFSRKLLLILSSLVMGVSLVLLGFSVYYLNHVKVRGFVSKTLYFEIFEHFSGHTLWFQHNTFDFYDCLHVGSTPGSLLHPLHVHS